MKKWFKENSTHFIIIAIFIVLVFFYFSPIFGGKTLMQHDVMQAEGSQKELFDYKALDGHAPLWTNSMFGGMPTYQIWYAHATNVTTYIGKALKTVFPVPTDIVLLYLLGGYFLFSVLRLKPWLAAVGAIALAFTSYNFIYIEAGHLNKAYAIAYLPPIIGAVLLCYRGNRLWGATLLALFMALEIRTNHIQMTYYLFIALLVFVLFELYHAIRDKKLKQFAQASAIQIGAVLLAVLVNASVLFPTYEYSKLTTRGKANIVKVEDGGKSGGLDKEYAYDWSQGVGENITFLIPNAYGGMTGGVLDEKSDVVKFFTSKGFPEGQALQIAQSLPTYWGEKRMTSGPWYFGAAVIFLFVLGLIIVKDRIKWWILAATVLIIFLAFGRHFPLISDIFFDYFPMYNKFRAVESTLVIAAILIPVLAMLAVNELLTKGDQIEKLDKKVLYTFIGVGGLCLVVALMPSLFLDFKTSTHRDFVAHLAQQLGDQGAANELANALVKDRTSLATKDAYRSLFIVALTFGLVWFYIKKKLNVTAFIAILGVVILADLWSVDKRYLNNDSFVDDRAAKSHVVEREVDQLIRLDKDPSYRVLDLTTNPFSDARASYFHKSLGGYHAAKLMRFQEILEHQFNGAINEDVLDMFNVRYLITQNQQNGAEQIQRRSTAAGNAWFVNKVTFVKDNAQEMQAISSFDPTKEAFVHEEFKDKLNASRLGQPANAEIKLVSYHPDTLKYESTSPNDAFAVFSEVYYDKGWKAYIDGKEVPIIRADYILRALQIPGGNHKIEFIFAPASMRISSMISLIASIVLVLGLAGTVYFSSRKNKAPAKK
ncbi:YfhO family protein [Sphingobacterium psychroaquaticum]|uniref:Membrane protein YfhO n=1 Tax=Sphingobacterium psychroaquaticum TaxID=561061 RepID=A0A1X7KZT0_9SPHI|nr:YfhO family protein [Sphingobacterium psychroaquaticum]SMG46389.1 membrane protein YfhO [Sphingobacterium psychroaquaticum]